MKMFPWLIVGWLLQAVGLGIFVAIYFTPGSQSVLACCAGALIGLGLGITIICDRKREQ